MPANGTSRPRDDLQSLPVQWGGIVGERRFRAMNTDIRIVAVDWRRAEVLGDAEDVFHEVEARFSRFQPDSELSAFNTRSEARIKVSTRMMQLVDLALYFSKRTHGMFEPAVLPALEAAGYDRSFERVIRDDPDAPAARDAGACGFSIAQVRLDRRDGTLTAPIGLRIDFGGIGKGYAVDIASERLSGTRDFLIDAGGDIFASGNGPDGNSWRIGIADPANDADLDIVVLRDQAIATSTTAKRRWKRGGRWHSHIIDPRTGASTGSEVVSASVIAETATEADVYAKCALMLGPDEGRRFLETNGAQGLLVLDNGSVVRTAGWPGIAPASNEGVRELCIAD
jgi:thiamine biosynthesis lipoprotein